MVLVAVEEEVGEDKNISNNKTPTVLLRVGELDGVEDAGCWAAPEQSMMMTDHLVLFSEYYNIIVA